MSRTPMTATLATLVLLAGTAGAQQGSLRFEKTIPFQRDQLINLGAQVGPVRVANVTLELGRAGGGGAGGGIRERVMARAPGGADPDTHTTLRASFDTENPSEEEWVVTYSLDFIDDKGRLIDRATKKKGFEGEASVFTVEHATLTYVLPFIDRVRIRLEAKYD